MTCIVVQRRFQQRVFAAGSVMSTSVGLGDNCQLVKPDVPSEPELPSEITITVDPTVNGVIPSDFPTSVNDKVTNGEFLLAGYTFGFESPVPFYLSSNKRIRFEKNGITSNNVAMIKLPVFNTADNNYRLATVELQSFNNKRRYRFSIVKNDGTELKGGEAKNLTDDPHTFELDSFNDNDEYNICISRSSSNLSSNTVDIVYISLKYVKI